MENNLTRIKDLAARARKMARWTMNHGDKVALTDLAKDYEQQAAEMEAKGEDPGSRK